ncbi:MULTISPECIES: glutathione-disulfide reductase [unclassified Aminobacter]|uniref:glutathione-disulfide reductase n=1 Tax=unclassified Aminobacter TaxID=2644704 RepID=UPI000466C63C|nr:MULTISPECIES: glutathione-disulfide reductase [unclassified Aminobacter]TWG49588.1 NADPH-glutathione reductase [Aminobacter sp. J44]TWH24481.1 NADPH-glutathione reductase [Aminobacter sp. J15]
MTDFDYDLFVIGGGSGGVRAARVSASLGRRVAIAEEYRFGGTCVIRGCVPKKLFVYASQFPEHFEDSAGYGWTVGETSFDWKTLVSNKDKEIARLEGLYRRGLENAGAEIIESRAVIEGPNTVRIVKDGRTVTARYILIATGGRPNPHHALPGSEHAITSNEAFNLEKLPKSILIAGGGYIAVEFANIFHGLGVETTLMYRGLEILGRFDMDLRRGLHKAMVDKGIDILTQTTSSGIEKRSDGMLEVKLSGGGSKVVESVMLAVGRTPNTEGLGLEKAGVEMGPVGEIVVDEYSRTNVESIYALGDVTNRVQLTPVAIHEAMCFVDTVFRDKPTAPDHEAIPTAVFSQPEIGTVGLSEDEAAKTYEELEIYRAEFRPMRHTLSGRQEKMIMKLVVDAGTRRVLGAHVLGVDAGEMAQLLGIAVKARLTKDDFDATMAVHPSAAEELVTMYQPSYRVRNGERVG